MFTCSAEDGNTSKNEIISDIISSTLEPKPESVLAENVTIVLWHNKVKLPLINIWFYSKCLTIIDMNFFLQLS